MPPVRVTVVENTRSAVVGMSITENICPYKSIEICKFILEIRG